MRQADTGDSASHRRGEIEGLQVALGTHAHTLKAGAKYFVAGAAEMAAERLETMGKDGTLTNAEAAKRLQFVQAGPEIAEAGSIAFWPTTSQRVSRDTQRINRR